MTGRWVFYRPAWWCEPCQSWWPGRWLLGFDDGTGDPANMRPPTDAEEEEYAYWCPECAARLEPRFRRWIRTEANP
jgi:hypothetical protein